MNLVESARTTLPGAILPPRNVGNLNRLEGPVNKNQPQKSAFLLSAAQAIAAKQVAPFFDEADFS